MERWLLADPGALQTAIDHLDMEAAIAHCTKGLGVWNWAPFPRHRRQCSRGPG
jgi:hypothetical protein